MKPILRFLTEAQRKGISAAAVAHHFDLPSFGTAGTSDSQVFDDQAMLEVTSSCLMAALSCANLTHDVGLLGNATVVMPDVITATNEIIAMLQHIICDIPIQDETLALDLTQAVGLGGEFVTHAHTLVHFRNVWYPELLYRGGAKAWGDPEDPLFEQRVNVRTRQLIESHQPECHASSIVRM